MTTAAARRRLPWRTTSEKRPRRVHLIAVPVDCSENKRVLIDELRSAGLEGLAGERSQE